MNINEYSPMSGRRLKEDGTVINEANYLAPTPIGHETLNIPNTEGGTVLTSVVYGEAIQANILVETAPIRYWLDGGVPTATEGILLNVGDVCILESAAEIAGFKCIAVDASATLQISYSA